jgi:hypothetical protein
MSRKWPIFNKNGRRYFRNLEGNNKFVWYDLKFNNKNRHVKYTRTWIKKLRRSIWDALKISSWYNYKNCRENYLKNNDTKI